MGVGEVISRRAVWEVKWVRMELIALGMEAKRVKKCKKMTMIHYFLRDWKGFPYFCWFFLLFGDGMHAGAGLLLDRGVYTVTAKAVTLYTGTL